MIKLQNISKTFNTNKGELIAVDNVNLTISQGEIFGIIGYSGAGKSTLIRLLNGLEKPTEGSVNINGQEISSISGKQLRQARQKVSMIFQHFNLFGQEQLRKIFLFLLKLQEFQNRKTRKRVEELIELVGLAWKRKCLSFSIIGGQKQRVGIARALANNPEVLLCDEATSALDPETTDSILELLVDINKRLGLTIVLITHEMHVIRKICHRVAVMEGGKVVEQGDVLASVPKPRSSQLRNALLHK